MRDLIAAALRDDAVGLQFEGLDVDALVAAAEYEHVLPLLEWKLRNAGTLQESPDAFRKAIGEGAKTAAMRSLFRKNEQHRIARVLAENGIRAILLKGNALALWLYPEPHLRQTSDIDLLFASRVDAHRAAEALSVLGYQLAFTPGSMNFEMTSRLTTNGVSRSDLDLHYRLINSVLYADIFDFEELFATSFSLPGINACLAALAPIHALSNACLNRALDMEIGEPDRLKLLYDIHLMCSKMDAGAWAEFIALMRAKELCGVCLRSIEDAVAVLSTPAPASAMIELQAFADAESLDRHRLQDWRYMQWQNFKALPTLRLRLRWLWERLIPTQKQLQELHGQDASLPKLLWRRITRGVIRIASRN